VCNFQLNCIDCRYSIPPTERIIPVGPHLHSETSVKLIREVKKMVEDFKRFLNSHNFNPAASLGYTLNEFQELIKEKPPGLVVDEIVGGEEEDGGDGDEDSLAEELRRIPHPNTATLEVLREFEQILDSMGPWCASRAIFLLNNKLTGMKVDSLFLFQCMLFIYTFYTSLGASSICPSLSSSRGSPHQTPLDSRNFP